MTLDRNIGQQRTALTNDLSTTPVLDIGGYSGLGLFVPSGVSSTSVSFYARSPSDGEYHPIYKDDGATAVTLSVTGGRFYALPTALFAFSKVKILTNAAETSLFGLVMKS